MINDNDNNCRLTLDYFHSSPIYFCVETEFEFHQHIYFYFRLIICRVSEVEQELRTQNESLWYSRISEIILVTTIVIAHKLTTANYEPSIKLTGPFEKMKFSSQHD